MGVQVEAKAWTLSYRKRQKRAGAKTANASDEVKDKDDVAAPFCVSTSLLA